MDLFIKTVVDVSRPELPVESEAEMLWFEIHNLAAAAFSSLQLCKLERVKSLNKCAVSSCPSHAKVNAFSSRGTTDIYNITNLHGIYLVTIPKVNSVLSSSCYCRK